MQSTQVTKLPEGAVNLWKSDLNDSEMYIIGSYFLSIQAHPEFNEHFFEKQLIKRLYDTLVIDKEQQTNLINELYNDNKPLFSTEIIRIVKCFIK